MRRIRMREKQEEKEEEEEEKKKKAAFHSDTVLKFRADRCDLILMLRLGKPNERLRLRFFRRSQSRPSGGTAAGCAAVFVQLSHLRQPSAMRGQEAYESERELEFGISQKGNSTSGQQLQSVNVFCQFPNLQKEQYTEMYV